MLGLIAWGCRKLMQSGKMTPFKALVIIVGWLVFLGVLVVGCQMLQVM
jgi:hypothetical protein